MNEVPLVFAGITETAERVAEGQLSPVQVVEAVLKRIQHIDPLLNTYICVSSTAREEASEAQAVLAASDRVGLLHGVPISVKDIILSRNMPTTAGSKVFGEGLEDGDAPVVKRLRKAWAILIGKNNLHEFAFGVTNENAHFGAARNPWNRDRVPGGGQRRLGGCGGRRSLLRLDRNRYPGFHSHPLGLLRYYRSEADPRFGAHPGCYSLELDIGPRGTHYSKRPGHGQTAPGDGRKAESRLSDRSGKAR